MTAIEDAVDSGVDEIGRFCARRRASTPATSRAAASSSPAARASCRRSRTHWASLVAAGRADHYELLDAAGAAERVRVEGALGGVFGTQYASMHPGRLVRGLARAVERRGGDHPRADRGRRGRARGRDTVASGRRCGPSAASSGRSTVVLAGEAYLTQLRPWHRTLLPTYSLIVLTEPLTDAQWATIGWRNRECLASYRLSIDYLTRTEDGRILFGGRGAPYRYGSRIEPGLRSRRADPRDAPPLRRRLVPEPRRDPASATPGAARSASRATGCRRSPTTRGPGSPPARGYTGHGVATANLAGRVLADLITGAETELTELPLVDHRSPRWEPEPFRWIGVRYVQEALLRVDAQGRADRPAADRPEPRRAARHR